MWQTFPLESLLGGMLLGISASLLLLFNGRIAGISGIVAGLLPGRATANDRVWRWLFVIGMVVGGFFAGAFWQGAIPSSFHHRL